MCRLYLQITHLSDISTGDGFRINAQFMGTDREPPFREATRNQFVWPRQPCPPLPFWKLWRHYISTTFTNYGTRLGQARPLKEEEYRSNWDWFVDMEEAELWKLTGDQWSRHALINPRRRTRTLQFSLIPSPHEGPPPIGTSQEPRLYAQKDIYRQKEAMLQIHPQSLTTLLQDHSRSN